MSLLRKFLFVSIGAKFTVAISAVALVLFLIAHLLGNLLVFGGPDAINAYAAGLREYPAFLWVARISLLSIFLLHLGLAIKLRIKNKQARPKNYVYKSTIQASLASRSMAITGMVMLSYVIYHLLHFTFGIIQPEYFQFRDSIGRHDVYKMLLLGFQSHLVTISYLIALFLTFVHLSHGIPSLLQTVGWDKPQNVKWIKKIGFTIALLLFIGYASIPVAIHWGFLSFPTN